MILAKRHLEKAVLVVVWLNLVLYILNVMNLYIDKLCDNLRLRSPLDPLGIWNECDECE